MESDQTPYMLNIDKDEFLIEDYKKIVKHHMSIQNVIRKLCKDEYTDSAQFKCDLDLMWNNLEMFFWNNSEVVRCANIIKNDIELVWTSSSD